LFALSEVFLEREFDVGTFNVTAISHPYGFTNKILLGSRQGALQLWNIKRSKLVHTFKGWGEEVTVLEQVQVSERDKIPSPGWRVGLYFYSPILNSSPIWRVG
jgi:hypothetical protein